EDALEFIHRFVSGDVAPPEWLLSELRNRHPLILGVHLPDWLERFMLRAATRDRLRLAQKVYFIAGDHISSGALNPSLHGLGLETTCDAYEDPADAFVEALHDIWRARHPNTGAKPLRPPEPRGSIFISYGRENLDAVVRLHDAIGALGGDAWFDRAEL